MYLFVYKTTHVNGKFYIGRHQTENLNDGYLGSGKWIKDVKDKTSLYREVIAEANSFEELIDLEEYYIDLYWEDPLCMNMKKASVGSTSEDNFRNVTSGTHPWQTRPDGTSSTSDKVKNGTHPFMSRPDGTNVQTDRVNNGTHHLLTRSDGSSVSSDRVNNGTHHLLTRSDGTNLQTDRVEAGTHNFLKNKGLVSCYDKDGKFIRISKDLYYSQIGSKENWEYVGINSKEGKLRKK